MLIQKQDFIKYYYPVINTESGLGWTENDAIGLTKIDSHA